jgi:hypothetical protein
MADAHGEPDTDLTFEEFRTSFSYGDRSDLNFKFFKAMSDDEVASFLQDVLALVGEAYDTGDVRPLVDAWYRTQIDGYAPDPGAPASAHTYDFAPFSPMRLPVTGAIVGLLTSSGHFVEGDDPEPFGVKEMTQAEAERRISEFLRTTPRLSEIPASTPVEDLRVRHGGYDTTSVRRDRNVAFPADRLAEAVESGLVAGTTSTFFSFPGATAQRRLQRELPQWLDRLADEHADAFLLVPV